MFLRSSVNSNFRPPEMKTSAFLIMLCMVSMAGWAQRLPLQERRELTALPRAEEKTSGRKSVTLAVAASLLLPGMGEWYAGNFETGRYLLIAEASLWTSYGGFYLYGNWLRTDARAFAKRHAGAQINGKDEQFEVNIGNFMNTEAYNEAKLRQREYSAVYSMASYRWAWDTDANRQRFKHLRIQSDEVHQYGRFVLAALVVNRIVSAFLAARAASAYNRRAQLEESWSIGIDLWDAEGKQPAFAVRFSQQF
jgi:hypothetical protein